MWRFSRLLGVSAVLMLVLLVRASPAHATLLFYYGMCNTSDGCDQTINFDPATTGVTVVDDTNPPNPYYHTTATSLDGEVLHAAGSTIDTVNGTGFNGLLLVPDIGWGWGAIEFQLDTIDNTLAIGTTGLTLTAWDQNGTPFTFSANLPWEGNKGENQHYYLLGTNGEAITKLQINSVNAIQDIHNIDVNSVRTVSEPGTLTLFGIGLVAVGRSFRRRVLPQ